MSTDAALDQHRSQVVRYYLKTESRFGYRYILGGAKHFGFYEDAECPAYPFPPALRRMERVLIQHLKVDGTARVLDAGSGMGVVACEVAAATGATVEGIDVLDFNVAAATQRAQDRGLGEVVNFQVMDYSALQFRGRDVRRGLHDGDARPRRRP